MPARTVGIVAHTRKEGAAELTRALLSAFANREIAVKLDLATARLVDQDGGLSVSELGAECDAIVVLGGDGTMLQVVGELGPDLKPIFGINLGSLGFLTCVNSRDYESVVVAIANDSYEITERIQLQVTVLRGTEVILTRTALNDAAVTRGQHSQLIRLRTRIDGAPFTEYNADGLIVATPTGSTAYSLSAGGPVMMPASGVFVITPVCPHVLTNRSLVVGDHSTIEISSAPRAQSVTLTVDGQECLSLEPSDQVRIQRAPVRVPFAVLPGLDFLSVLRKKLKWSGNALGEGIE